MGTSLSQARAIDVCRRRPGSQPRSRATRLSVFLSASIAKTSSLKVLTRSGRERLTPAQGPPKRGPQSISGYDYLQNYRMFGNIVGGVQRRFRGYSLPQARQRDP